MFEYKIFEKYRIDRYNNSLPEEIREADIHSFSVDGWKVHSVFFDSLGNIKKILFERLIESRN